MAPPLEFTFRLVPLTLKLLEARRVGPAERLRLVAELPEGAATASEVTVALDVVQRFLERAEAAARVPSLGLALAQAVPRGTYAWLEYIARLSCTLEEAMSSVGRYYRLVNKGADINYVERGDWAGVEICVHGRAEGWGRQLNEYTVALFYRMIRELSPGWEPVNVWFAHGAPERAATLALATYFGGAPQFGCASSGLEGPGELVDQPLPSGDAALQQLLAAQAARTLAEQVPLAGLASRVREELRRRMGKESVAIDVVAPALGLSARSLQRKLRDEGQSYQDVLDAVRAQLAKAWLANRNRSVQDLAWKLGYSEPSAFDRAFRRWTGQTPTAWREAVPT